MKTQNVFVILNCCQVLWKSHLDEESFLKARVLKLK